MEEEDQAEQLHIQIEETAETTSNERDERSTINLKNNTTFSHLKNRKMWFRMAIYSIMVLSGQSAATLLTRLYYGKGGESKYIAALVQSAGFPILLPIIIIATRLNNPVGESSPNQTRPYRNLALPALYVGFGTFLAFDCMLYAVGLMHLPASTFSLICASQLGFNAFFSYFINSQKLTPVIVNSIVLLTVSTFLLVLDPDSSATAAHGNYGLGAICTVGGAAGYALLLSLQQLAYGKVLERQTVAEIVKVIFFESTAATSVLLAGFFASGEWRHLNEEINGFELGKRSYAVVLVLAALGWQVFGVGMVSLILKVSSLFANAITTLNVPVVPVLAAVFFRDEMSGMKLAAMFLAVWGFVSYVYQQYLDSADATSSSPSPSSSD